jgi:hypothetical protein
MICYRLLIILVPGEGVIALFVLPIHELGYGFEALRMRVKSLAVFIFKHS